MTDAKKHTVANIKTILTDRGSMVPAEKSGLSVLARLLKMKSNGRYLASRDITFSTDC